MINKIIKFFSKEEEMETEQNNTTSFYGDSIIVTQIDTTNYVITPRNPDTHIIVKVLKNGSVKMGSRRNSKGRPKKES